MAPHVGATGTRTQNLVLKRHVVPSAFVALLLKGVTSCLEDVMFGVAPNAHPTYRRIALLTELM